MSAVSESNGRILSAPQARSASRLNAFLFAFAAVLCILGLRLVHLQIFLRPHYVALGQEIEQGPRSETPRRGGIYARDLTPLAESVQVFSLCADPLSLAGGDGRPDLIPATASALSSALGMDHDGLVDQLRSAAKDNSRFLYIERLLSPEQEAIATGLGLKYLWTEPEWRRVYHRGEFACHVIGRCSSHHEPLEGIEARWDFVLAGKPGTRRRDLDAYGRRILGQDSRGVLPPEDGHDLVLTIDPKLQDVAEMALDDCMRINQPDNATCVVLDADTGEILACASRPGYNPEHIEPCSPEQLKARLDNVPTTRAWEPGSIFKVLLAAAVLETNACSPDETFYCGGVMEVAGKPLRCWG
ncbi:MAG TPA: penicillin-binding transpeptidase domain-containing protein, partial [Armatimonadota bacterium]|nr:penicillin-binding transpeptidase domain-containing protein [Armatimonadota bacterium]